MNIKKEMHKRHLENRKEDIKTWGCPDLEKKKFLKFLEEGAVGRVNKGNKWSNSTLVRYAGLGKLYIEFFNKTLNKVTIKDVEKFEKYLTNSKYKKSTQNKIKKQLKMYMKWRVPEKANNLVGWLDTKSIKKTPDYLTEEEIIRLYKNCKNAEERYIIAVLFDSGARVEEFYNIRYEDIQLPEKGENFVKLTLKQEYSKSKGRVISLYWKYSLEAVRDFVKEKEQEGIKNDEQMFPLSYTALRKRLQRLGKKVLHKSIHCHLFRHTSATHYASKLNRQELCYRYGWTFSSDMADIYISRAGMQTKELDEKFKSTKLEEIEKDLQKERFEHSKQIEEQKKEIKKQNKKFELFKKEILDQINN